MRKQIETWLSAWFHFNQQERRGIVPLLVLVVLLQSGIWAYNAYKPVRQFDVQVMPWPVDSTSSKGNTEEADTRDRHVFKRPFESSFKVNGSFERHGSDSFVKRRAPAQINLNETDSATLELLPGIGPVIAGKIIRYREQLGGYRDLMQLTEIRGFKEDLLFDLESRLIIKPGDHRKFSLNTVTFEELKKHPYFKFTLSRVLVNYREQHGPYRSLNDLRQIKMMNDSIFQLVTPYLSLESNP